MTVQLRAEALQPFERLAASIRPLGHGPWLASEVWGVAQHSVERLTGHRLEHIALDDSYYISQAVPRNVVAGARDGGGIEVNGCHPTRARQGRHYSQHTCACSNIQHCLTQHSKSAGLQVT